MVYHCYHCTAEYDTDDEQDLYDNDWTTIDNEWYCPNCYYTCRWCDNNYCCDDGITLANGDSICDCCADNGATWCESCEEYYDSDEVECCYIHSPTGAYDMNVCEYCMRDQSRFEHREWNNSEGRWEVYQNSRTEELMNRIYQNCIDTKVKTLCDECNEYDYRCPKCLKKLAELQEREETELWVYDSFYRGYHSCDHFKFKGLKLRDKHEHPYLYYGIELEVGFDSRPNSEVVVDEFVKATNGLFVAEQDSSINDDYGIEFISRPLSYTKWMSEEVKELLNKGIEVLKNHNAKSIQSPLCGLHCHMSLKFFERNTEKPVDKIKSDIDWVFQVFQEEVEKISRRPYYRYCDSKKGKLEKNLNTIGMLRGVKGRLEFTKGELEGSTSGSADHSSAITQSGRTIEIRTFKSTIDVEQILATIEFCRAVAHASRNMNLTEDNTLGDIVYCKDSIYLEKYLKQMKVDTSKKFSNTVTVTL